MFATLPLFAMLAAVGNARFLSDANDPIRRAETSYLNLGMIVYVLRRTIVA